VWWGSAPVRGTRSARGGGCGERGNGSRYAWGMKSKKGAWGMCAVARILSSDSVKASMIGEWRKKEEEEENHEEGARVGG